MPRYDNCRCVCRCGKAGPRRGRPRGQQPFSLQKGGQASKTLQNLRELVMLEAGGEAAALFKEYCRRYSVDFSVPSAHEQQANRAAENCLRNLLCAIKISMDADPSYYKCRWIALLIKAGLTHQSARQYGLCVGKKLWKSGLAHVEQCAEREQRENKKVPVTTVPERYPARRMPSAIKTMVLQFLYDDHNTYIAANRTVVVSTSDAEGKPVKEIRPVRYVSRPLSTLYTEFVQQYREALIAAWGPKNAKRARPKTLSRSSFYSLVPPEI